MNNAGFYGHFLRRPVATAMLNASLVVFGLLGLQRLPVRELPDIDPPIVNVLTVYPGASAEVVESEVTERLEEALGSVESVRLLTSESREQVSSIVIEFTAGRDVDIAAQDVRDRLARARGELPSDIEEPVISKQDAAASPIIWIAFFSDWFNTQELSEIADRQVKDRLQTVPGVSSVIIGGEKKRAMRIRLDSEAMSARGITLAEIELVLASQNIELPSGRVESTDRELAIQTRGQLNMPREFERLVVRQTGVNIVRLGDIAKVEYGVEDERAIARFKQQPSIGLGVVRQSRANTLDVARLVKERMNEIAPTLPAGVSFEFPYDESVYVQKSVTEVWSTLGLAFGLVVLVIFTFLRNVRSTFIPALAIPISIVTTFGVMYVLGYTVNTFTLLALVLAIGLVVDDAIVVLENVYRHLELGESPKDAAAKAMGEIAFAVIATTLSLVAVFLPITFIGGVTGRLLREFALTLSSAVIISSIVALTLTPVACSLMLKTVNREKHNWIYRFMERRLDGISRRYDKWLGRSLRHRWVIVLLSFASLALSWMAFKSLSTEFLPAEDKGRFLAIAITPQGSTPEYSDRMVAQLENIVADFEEVESYFGAVALPFNGPGDPTFAILFARLTDGPRRNVRDIVGGPAGLGFRFFNDVEGAISFPILPKAVDLGFSQPFQMVITHPDLNRLNDNVERVVNALRGKGYLANLRSTFEMNKPEINVEIDRARAEALGVSVRDISRTLQVLFGGLDLSEVKVQGKQYDVIVQLEREMRSAPEFIERLHVRTASGTLVPLGSLVTLTEGAGPNQIERFQRERSATIEGTPAGVPLGTAVAQATATARSVMDPEAGIQWKGEARDLGESSRDIYLFMLLAIIVVYMVLAAQFESLVHPITVMVSLPLAFLGAFGLLYILSWVDYAGNMMYGWSNYAPDAPPIAHTLAGIIPRIPSMNLNIFSQVGLILLIGLVTKNSILLVEFANQQRARGLSGRDAMREAGRIRLRPILMTSFSTIAGMLPIAIGFGDAAESRRPLGVAAVGGLFTATILTLFVIPVVYSLFADLGDWLRRSPSHRRPTPPSSLPGDSSPSTIPDS